MAVTAKNWQTTLNVSGSVVTIATGGASGSQISSIYLVNTNSTTSRTVTLLANGTGTTTANIIFTGTIAPSDTLIIQNPNCPIVLTSGNTLRGYQDTGTDVNVFANGLDN